LEHIPNGSLDDDGPAAEHAHSEALGVWSGHCQLGALSRDTRLTTDDGHMFGVAGPDENIARNAEDAFDRGRNNAARVASTTEHVVLEGPWETARCGQAGL
jgi:hypothetical protein